ncbi:PrsW family glutamic-type intramembrane protease [Myxacorys almedinensis]|uniref:PrsW family intramembrane metalloprotease n=1 Tax=Myxacorys almedinensis A TaxID=2690445 RepID=A0A8J7Z4L6_9CYAN|nr:PrsW family glutamic-type intramembrane protease [Myxacorys almedinensis]NDJ19904.1 PrsW family intramembrane metalloprotease [Myxacorys almedinensis A]
MTGESSAIASLRQLPTRGKPALKQHYYPLPADRILAIGRDPRCQIVVDPVLYASVSRRHVEVRPTAQPGTAPMWWICDLNSSNGTYLNGKRLRGCEILQSCDRITLGRNGPEYIFEYSAQAPSAHPPNGLTAPPPEPSIASATEEGVTFTQLFPILSTGRDLTRKAFLAPSMITIGFVVAMFLAVGHAVMFNLLIAGYLAIAAYYFVYQLCGKHKPWWVAGGAAFATIALLRSPILPLSIVLFRQILPGQVPDSGESINFLVLLIRMFFGAGLMEELLKALPLLGFFLLGRFLPLPWSRWVGIWEPLDGILLGVASAVGFTLLETLGQYVPDAIQNTTLQAGEGLNQLVGLQLLIPRLLGSISGHMAYSGYFGYFIGLSVLKPKQSPVILTIGYLAAACLHALWNAMGIVSPVILALVGILSYACLAAAILKARSLSPTRSQNFATRLRG